MKLERYCARCARENKRIKPEYLESHGSPTFHPKAVALCPKHGIAMPLVLRVDDKTNINLVSMSIETQDVVEALINMINIQDESIRDTASKIEKITEELKKTRKNDT